MTVVIYQHSQRTSVWLGGFAVLEIVVLVAMIVADVPLATLIIFLAAISLLVLVLALFSRLRVEVDAQEVRAIFGSGWPRRAVALGDIQSASVVRNKWWYGWGIRFIGRGWLWNVWGLDAVELMLANGKRFRIGTDDPEGLRAALATTTPTS